MARNNPPFSRRPGKEKAGNLIIDFLLGGAAGGRLVFSCKSSGQRGSKGDGAIKEKQSIFLSLKTLLPVPIQFLSMAIRTYSYSVHEW